MDQPKTYRQKPIEVKAIQWEPEVGAQFGVRERPKKHHSNPDEFYVRNRFGKEKLILPGDWVITHSTGGSDIISRGAFLELYELVTEDPPKEESCQTQTTKD